MVQQTALTKLRHAFVLGALPVALATSVPTVAQAFSFSNLYVFGDSLSDTGNAFAATGGTLPPEPFYTNGRFSNGPVWVEYLAPQLGLTLNPQNDFAFGGATTGSRNTFVPTLPGLQQQISAFTQAPADPNALYIVWAGANDYLGGASDLDPANPVSKPITNLTNAIAALAKDGAKTFLVANLPDLGALPGTQGNNQLTAVSAAHDRALDQALSLLGQQAPDVTIIPFNVAALFSDAITNPAKYGFTNVTDSCLLTRCKTPDTYLFWDPIHPTTTGHAAIANAAFFSISSAAGVPEPSTVLGVATFGAFLAGMAARNRRRPRSLTIDGMTAGTRSSNV